MQSMMQNEHWFPLAGISLAHFVLLGALLITLNEGKPLVIPPTMTGMLVAPVSAEPPKPLPSPPEQQKPREIARPKPAVLPKLPPSERAITVPQQTETVQRPEPAANPPAVAQAAAPMAANEAPIVPPRSDASHLNNPAPAYPPMSRKLAEQGRVLLDVYILADGSVGQIKLKHSSGYARLDEAAREAVQRWRYVPARRGGEAIPFWYVQPLTFSLDR